MPTYGGTDEFGNPIMQRDDGSFFSLPQSLGFDPSMFQGIQSVGNALGNLATPNNDSSLFQGMQGMGGAVAPPPPPPPAPVPAFQPSPIPKRAGQYDTRPEGTMAANAIGQERQLEARQQAIKDSQAQESQQIENQGLGARAAANQKNFQDYQKQMQAIDADRENLRREVDNFAQQQIDPQALFKNASTWGKIAMGVSMAIGGFLNPRGPNMAAEAINRLIEQDIKGQEVNMAHQGQVINTKLAMNREDAEGAASDFKVRELNAATAWSLVQEQAKQVLNSTTSESAKLNAQILMAKAEAEKTTNLQKVATENANRAEHLSAAYATVSAAKVHEQGEMLRQVQKQAYESWKAPLLVQEGLAKTEGKEKDILDPETGQSLGKVPVTSWERESDYVGSAKLVYQIMANMRLAQEQYSFWQKHPDLPGFRNSSLRIMKSSAAELVNRMRSLDKFGARPSKQIIDLEKDFTGSDPESWFTPDNSMKLDNAMKWLRVRVGNDMRSKGLKSPLPQLDTDISPEEQEFGRTGKIPTRGSSTTTADMGGEPLDDLGATPR